MKVFPISFKTSLLFLAIGFCFFNLISCTKKEAFSTTKSGLQYSIVESKGGKKPAIGDVLKMHMIYKTQRDSLLYDSKIIGDSFMIQLGAPSFIGGLEEGFAMLGEGDSAIFRVPADSVYQKLFKQAKPEGLAADEQLKFFIRLDKVLSQKEFNENNQRIQSEWDRKEDLQIIAYLKKNNLVTSPVADGVYLIPFEMGKGKTPKKGDSVEVKYIGKFLSGEVFDDSEKAKTNLTYRLGDGSRMPVWEKTIASMKEGSFYRLILASRNAFKNRQYGPIPPNSTIIYDIRLVKVRPAGKAS